MALSHPLDHLVLPTGALETARARLSALGFTVAPRGVHPFGTENCCVYFHGGTFMEPLAIGDAKAVENAVAGGNVFVSRDRDYRKHLGDEGFSAIVLGTHDADADHARYVAAGISAGDRLDFSRPFVDCAGNSDTASFRLAFAAARQTPESFVFSCERVNAPKVDRSALQAHPNGVQGIVEIVALSSDPARQAALIGLAAGATSAGNSVTLPNALVAISDEATFANRFGISPSKQASNLRFAAVVFSLTDLAAQEARLAANGINYHLHGDNLIVAPAPGQGAIFVFRETP